jgi:hypothetical protein
LHFGLVPEYSPEQSRPMKTIRAYSCIRDNARNTSGKPAGAVCFLLNEAHATHTLRAFLRGQGDSAVLEPMSEAEASRLLGADLQDEPAAAKKSAA